MYTVHKMIELIMHDILFLFFQLHYMLKSYLRNASCVENSICISGIHLFLVGVGLSSNNTEATGMVSPPSSRNRIDVTSYSELSTLERRMADQICERTYE